jgi:hypothetical protein
MNRQNAARVEEMGHLLNQMREENERIRYANDYSLNDVIQSASENSASLYSDDESIISSRDVFTPIHISNGDYAKFPSYSRKNYSPVSERASSYSPPPKSESPRSRMQLLEYFLVMEVQMEELFPWCKRMFILR